MYDVLSTVRYPNLYREMGVGMCASRLIDDVTPEDVRRTGESFGVPTTVVCEIAHEIAEDFTGAMLSAGETWRDRGFGEARPMAREMAAEAAGRLRVLARV